MPPNPRSLSYGNPSLSDEDVRFLHQVVVYAQKHPEVAKQPSRALFEAFDELIARYGVTDPGQAHLRFIFKLGSKSASGLTLYEKFVNQLRQMGIEIQFDGEPDNGNEMNDDRRNVDEWYDDSFNNGPGLTRRRRASLSSLYDLENDTTQKSSVDRPSSPLSLSRLQTGKSEFLGSEQPPGRIVGGERGSMSDRTQLIAQFLDVGRRLMTKMDAWGPKGDRQAERGPSIGQLARSAVDRDRSERENLSIGFSTALSLNSWDSDEDDNGATHQGDGDDSAARIETAREMFHRPSVGDLFRDAWTFNSYRERAISRKLLTQWLMRAVKLRQAHCDMQAVAVNRDRATLLHQAFATWYAIIQQRQQTARTQRLFEHLEERAGRARDLYLMTKAFTHWAEIVSDEAAKVSAARRHVLGTKYFNAWREITAVNELKAQRFVLRRPFDIWRKKLSWIKNSESAVLTIHDMDLKRGAYWQWFWSLCDLRAPQWYDNHLKKRSLLCWLRNFRTNRERYHEVELRVRQSDIGSVLLIWSERSKSIVTAAKEAETRLSDRLLRESFDAWKCESRLAPISSRVSRMASERLLRNTYVQWVSRALMLEQAEEMDRLRVMRRSWRVWNDLLRCRALSARIEERLRMETLYKWVLAERYRLMQRIRDHRITHEVFSMFVMSIRETYTLLLQRAAAHKGLRAEETIRSKFICWKEQLIGQRQREHLAVEFYMPRLAGEAVVAWREKHQYIVKLEKWARDAHFYFLMTKTIRWWHIARLESSKRRRQEAYARTRRGIKINMASKAFEILRSRARHISEMERQAVRYSREGVLVVASEALGRWHQKAEKRARDCSDANVYHSRQIAFGQLARWSRLSTEIRTLDQTANQFHHLHSLSIASLQLRKLSLRVFQIRSTGETADSMGVRNMRKHCKILLRYWAEMARLRVEFRGSPALDASPSRRFNGAASSDGDQPVFDPWYQSETPFKFNDLVERSQGPSYTPLATPSYMVSPSKRAARARALAQISTTPATPLQTPFATRLLRAETKGSSRTGPNRLGRSGRRNSPGNSVRFADQQEPESPTDGKHSGSRRI